MDGSLLHALMHEMLTRDGVPMSQKELSKVVSLAQMLPIAPNYPSHQAAPMMRVFSVDRVPASPFFVSLHLGLKIYA